MPNDARALANVLRGLPREELRARFSLRGVDPGAPWKDFYDAADALLDAAAVREAVSALPAEQAIALTSGAEITPATTEALAERSLLNPDSARAYDAVAAAIASLPTAEPLPVAAALEAPVNPATAAERALTTVTALADLLLHCRQRPIHQLGNGTIGMQEKRRLVEAGIITVPEALEPMVTAAVHAGLVHEHERQLVPSENLSAWLSSSNAHRWQSLTSSLWKALPKEAREAGALPLRSWPALYPWSTVWRAESERLFAAFVALGVTNPQQTLTTWARGDDTSTAAVADLLPHEVDKLYIQNDLTAIAPGPLQPVLDVRMRTLAAHESTSHASTYRFTAGHLAEALTSSETIESIRAFLMEISLTGVPQPLDYLLSETARKVASIVLYSDPVTGSTMIDVDSEQLAETLRVDQALRPLAFVRDGLSLHTRVSRDVAARALSDARYAFTLRTSSLTHNPHIPESDDSGAPRAYDDLITRLQSVPEADEGRAWLARELDAAVRNKATVEVTVSLPDGDRVMQLEATGLGGGRLRGRDRAADVERTLPLSHISQLRVL